MTDHELLKEYHRRIGEIFLARNQTPFRISKQIWRLHAEMERRLTLLGSDAAISNQNAGQTLLAAPLKPDC
jgi:hypothetical protein